MSGISSIDTRRARLRRLKLNGLDEVEVTPDRHGLLVRFFQDAPTGMTPANLRIAGGVAVRHLHVLDVQVIASDDPDIPSRVLLALDRSGDASTYHLHVRGVDGIDQRYTEAPFQFFPDADDGLDCAETVMPAPPPTPVPPLDYLAKDYLGFRQVMLDRLAVTMPGWQEAHVPDVGIMLVELLAYVADRLSYFQDAVATEAYLGTARRRISIRRHVRLIDYALHEGCNARALVQIDPAVDASVNPSTLIFLLAGQDQAVQFRPLPVPGDIMALCQAHTKMEVHCWGDTVCVLPKGAMSATLVDPAGESPPSLRKGDFLILEQVIAGLDASADPNPQTRHPVRLTEDAKALRDELLDKSLLQVTWSAEDALPVDFPFSTVDGETTTVVRGNMLLADQGRLVTEGDGGLRVQPVVGPGRRRSITLRSPGLSFAEPVPTDASARHILAQRNPRAAMPLITRLRSWPAKDPGAAVTDWVIRPDLIESGPDDPHAMVEVDNDGTTLLRFGDGVCGRDPADQAFEIAYRVGNGAAGNIGADTLVRVALTSAPVAGMPPATPLPGVAGTPPAAPPAPARAARYAAAGRAASASQVTTGTASALPPAAAGTPVVPPATAATAVASRRYPAATAPAPPPAMPGAVRNPLPASGGTDPEDVEQVRLLAPFAFQNTPMRAISADDYAALAVQLEPAVQRARCSLVPSGGRQLARVAIDPFGSDAPNEALERRVAAALEPFRRVGHDVMVVRGDYVPLLLVMRVNLMSGYMQMHLRAALRTALGTGVLPNGSLAAFHPETLTFGTSIHGSRLVAIAQALEGVRSVTIIELARLFDRERGVFAKGVLRMAWNEIPQLDNDPMRPDHGRLVLHLAGGLT